jgi:hypothetical protein
MRKFLRIAALVVLLGGLGFWAAKGANTGWTKNRVEVKKVDEVTGIEAINYEERFIPGVEFLGGVVAGAGALAGLSFLFGRKNKLETASSS